MRPDEYEQLVAQYFQEQGFCTEVTPITNDYGVDVFATKGNYKLAIQAKMYGDTNRSINRKMIMELHGAKDYFGCTKAILATDGNVLDDAYEVAQKLGIEILNLNATSSSANSIQIPQGKFEKYWEEHVMPLEGRTLIRKNGKTNIIKKVDWSGIKRITSNGKPQNINIEIFELTINHLIKYGSITRKEINNQYSKRASSGVVLILSNTSHIAKTNKPSGLRLLKNI